jgi:hypothetical protein
MHGHQGIGPDRGNWRRRRLAGVPLEQEDWSSLDPIEQV